MIFYSKYNILFFKYLVAILIIFNTLAMQGQVLDNIQPFSAGTSFQEPDGRKVTLKLNNQIFLTLTKSHGGIAGDATYVLQKYDLNLKPLFTTEIEITENDEFKEMYVRSNEIVLISITHAIEQNTSTLKYTTFDLNTGIKKEERIIQEAKINKWVSEKTKGAIKQTFTNFVGATIGQHYTTPFQYQFEFKFSPDSSKILTYIFDYSQKNTIANSIVFDRNFNKISEGEIHIDNNFINYGLFLNDAGEVVILNTDKQGRIVVVEYDLKTHQNKFLDIQYTSARRESLKLHIVSNDIVYVANLVTANSGKLLAVMYSRFNFKSHLVEKINFHELTEGLIETAKQSREAAKIHGEENWMNYEVSDFLIGENEKIIFIAEKREIESNEFIYDHSSTNDLDKWHESTGKVGVEGVLIFEFAKNDELIFENYCAKFQSADLVSGINSASYSMSTINGKMRFIYSSSDSPSGIFNTIHYLEWDENKGTLLKEMKLPNPESLGLMRNYTVWYKDKVIVVGKKGIMGKKSFITSYKLE